jgi:hypothetical protein
VILLTGLKSPATVLCALRQGATACFFKPFIDIEGMVEVIADVNKSNARWRKALGESTEPHSRRPAEVESSTDESRIGSLV